MRLILLLLPMQLITHPLPSVRVQKLEYSEHIRQKLNSILEIPEGRNYWEKEFKTINYENKLKQYLQHGN
jgi:phage baseplate assembly protein W